MRIWLTKHALSSGIREVEGKVDPLNEDVITYGRQEFAHGRGRAWHDTEESALKRAEEMRDRRVRTMERRLVKLKGMTFQSKESLV